MSRFIYTTVELFKEKSIEFQEFSDFPLCTFLNQTINIQQCIKILSFGKALSPFNLAAICRLSFFDQLGKTIRGCNDNAVNVAVDNIARAHNSTATTNGNIEFTVNTLERVSDRSTTGGKQRETEGLDGTGIRIGTIHNDTSKAKAASSLYNHLTDRSDTLIAHTVDYNNRSLRGALHGVIEHCIVVAGETYRESRSNHLDILADWLDAGIHKATLNIVADLCRVRLKCTRKQFIHIHL